MGFIQRAGCIQTGHGDCLQRATPSNVCTFSLEKLQWWTTAMGKEKALADEFLSTPIEESPSAELFNKVKGVVGV